MGFPSPKHTVGRARNSREVKGQGWSASLELMSSGFESQHYYNSMGRQAAPRRHFNAFTPEGHFISLKPGTFLCRMVLSQTWLYRGPDCLRVSLFSGHHWPLIHFLPITSILHTPSPTVRFMLLHQFPHLVSPLLIVTQRFIH